MIGYRSYFGVSKVKGQRSRNPVVTGISQRMAARTFDLQTFDIQTRICA